jgi:hypothetical protein
MAITSAVCNSYKQEVLNGVHVATDVYKIALYTSAATLGATTTSYSTTNEVVGVGYVAGGNVLEGYSSTVVANTVILDWTTDPSWINSTISARGALIYNSSKSNKAVCVLNFGADYTTNLGTLTVKFPTPDATNGLIRF